MTDDEDTEQSRTYELIESIYENLQLLIDELEANVNLPNDPELDKAWLETLGVPMDPDHEGMSRDEKVAWKLECVAEAVIELGQEAGISKRRLRGSIPETESQREMRAKLVQGTARGDAERLLRRAREEQPGLNSPEMVEKLFTPTDAGERDG